MKKVVIQYDNHVNTYYNVTKVQCFCALDLFEAYIVIYENEKKTVIMICEMNGFEVID